MTDSAIILLSGGLDSSTVLAQARSQGKTCHALAFRYGQRHQFELQAARTVASALGAATFRTIEINLADVGGSALTAAIDVPKDRSETEMSSSIPITYVPARNSIFVAYAIAVAEVLGAGEIIIGVNALDYSGYPDCRPEWVVAMQEVARLGTKAGVEGRPVKISAPLIHLKKAEIIALGTSLGVNYSLTHSCYDPSENGGACGRCDSCSLRRAGFAAAGVQDPTRYAFNAPA